MQSLKDTFYVTLRDRIAAGNAARVVVVRGTLRPGVIVVENELPGAAIEGIALPEAFCLRWTGLKVDTDGPQPLTSATCEIRYATDGTMGSAAMDRGRGLAAMDAELATALGAEPRGLAGIDGDQSVVFWGDVTYGPAAMHGERMTRTATVEVFGYGG